MGSYRLRILSCAREELMSLPFPLRRQVNHKICSLKRDPRPEGWEPLDEGIRVRLRVHRHRILYAIDDEKALVTVYAIRRPAEV